MRIIYIGSVLFSKKILEKLIEIKAEIVGVISKEKSSFNSDFCDLIPLAKQNNIDSLYIQDINSEKCLSWIKSKSPDIIYCLGWSNLIKKPLLELSPRGVVGFHPSLLPKNKGRHPLIWAKTLGLKESGCTFFFMDEGADSGPILSQMKFNISFEDTAFDLYNKMTQVGLIQIEKLTLTLSRNEEKRTLQPKEGNSWRKRTQKDGVIDFRMSTKNICNLVRALSKPYVGASCFYKNEEVKVWEVQPSIFNPDNFEPGKIVSIDENQIIVKTGDKSIILTHHDFKEIPEINQYLNV